MTESIEVQELQSQREALRHELATVKRAIHKTRRESAHGSFPIVLVEDEMRIEAEIRDLDRRIAASAAADVAIDSLESIATELGGDLESIRKALPDTEPIASLEKQIAALTEVSRQTIRELKATSLVSVMQPRMSVIRGHVKYIDANLAYKYADQQSDFNTLIGLTTLFLGTGIASAVSLGVSLAVASGDLAIALHATVTVMSLFVTIIFGFLALRARRKAEAAREDIETEAGDSEISLPLALPTTEYQEE